MLFTNFRWKYVLHKLVVSGFQLFDTGRLHPASERAIRDLNRSVDYVESRMADALGLETQREVLEYALSQTHVAGHYLEFGVFTGGTIRFLAKQIRRTKKGRIHGFDRFEGPPQAWGGFNLRAAAFFTRGKLPRGPPHPGPPKGPLR